MRPESQESRKGENSMSCKRNGQNQSPVFILDATTRLGIACALELASKGVNLVLFQHGQTLAEGLERELEKSDTEYRVTDIEPWDEEGMEGLTADVKSQFGGIHGMVYNYFRAVPGSVSRITEQEFTENYERNIKAPFFTTQAIASKIGRQEHGKLIYFTSIQDEKPNGREPLYSMAMAAVKNMSREAALAYGPFGTASIVIELGPSEEGRNAADSRYTTFFDGSRYKTPIQEDRRAEAAAKLCAFLLSDDCRFVNGAELRMDGGFLLHYMDEVINHRVIQAGGEKNG